MQSVVTANETIESVPRWYSRGGLLALLIAITAWLVVGGAYLSKRIALSPDSMNNYAHVWWIAQGIARNHRIPWAMPVLGHGDALTFPYGFLNWSTAGLLWSSWGDSVTTAWTLLGAVGSIVATFIAFPELRKPWYATAALCNPVIILGLLFGQQTFLWSATVFLLGISAWRRDRYQLAAVFVGLAQANHAAVVLPMGCVVAGIYWMYTANRSRLARWYAVALVISAPAAVLVFISPAFSSSSTRDRVVNFFSTLSPRILIVAVPIVMLITIQRSSRRQLYLLGPTMVLVCLLGNFAINVPLSGYMGWRTFGRVEHRSAMQRYLASSAYHASATHRLLRGSDSKLGMYMLLQAGGRLDSEFFPESQAMVSFASSDAYASLLCERRIDQVVAFRSYDLARHTNEHRWLSELGNTSNRRVGVKLIAHDRDFDVFDVARHC